MQSVFDREKLMSIWTQRAHGGEGGRILETFFPADRPVLDLSQNLNPLGPPPALMDELKAAVPRLIPYDAADSRKEAGELARDLGLEADDLILGNGAADLIQRLILALERFYPGETMVFVEPGFSEYRRTAERLSMPVHRFLLEPENDFQLKAADIPELLSAGRICFLCSPNNPTGTLLSPEVLAELQAAYRAANGLLIIDQCFLDFVPEPSRTMADARLGAGQETVILYSLTKIFALAGIRLGYLWSKNRTLLAQMEALQAAWNLNALARYLARRTGAYLKTTEMEEGLARIQKAKIALRQTLEQLGARVWGEANFLFFQMPDASDLQIFLAEWRTRIWLRACLNYPGLGPESYRMAVPHPDDLDEVMAALKAYACERRTLR